MGNFDRRIEKFIAIFWEQGGYVKVAQGLTEYAVDRQSPAC